MFPQKRIDWIVLHRPVSNMNRLIAKIEHLYIYKIDLSQPYIQFQCNTAPVYSSDD